MVTRKSDKDTQVLLVVLGAEEPSQTKDNTRATEVLLESKGNNL